MTPGGSCRTSDRPETMGGSPGTIAIVSTNVGVPVLLGLHQGEPVLSGIRKFPLETVEAEVGFTNIVGDGQADLVNHGGPDKAVYAYPFEHLAKWNDELGPTLPFGPASFGENLTTIGASEHDVCIGDIWQIGNVTLQICQPRYPCYKLAMAIGVPEIVKLMVRNGRTGWYLRVLKEGVAPTVGGVEVLERNTAEVTVAEAHEARLSGASTSLVRRVAAVEALASNLRMSMIRELS